MKKTGLKTFVFSFVFSLFVIIATNRVLLRTSPAQEKELEIPSKNITLFFKQDGGIAPAKAQKIKKIALSAPKKETPSIEVANAVVDIPEPIELYSPPQAAEEIALIDPIPTAVAEETIPLEFSPQLEALYEPEDTFEPEVTLSEAKVLVEPENIPLQLADKSIVYQKEESNEPAIAMIEKESELKQAERAPAKDVEEKIVVAQNNIQIPLERGNTPEKELSGKVVVVEKADQNKTAMVKSNTTSKEIEESEGINDSAVKAKTKNENWETMSSKTQKSKDDSPWVVAKGAKHPTNNAVLDQDYYKDMSENEIQAVLSGKNTNAEDKGGEVKLAADMVQNILIPIPEEILNEENLTPQLISDKSEDTLDHQNAKDLEGQPDEDKASILKSLSSIFSSKKVGVGKAAPKDSGFFDEITKKGKSGKAPSKILPTEMRLSFQPGRAEISGQTLKWLQAFAQKAQEEDDVVLEVRIDGTSSFELQQKRLNLLQNILRSKGLNLNKVNTIFTTREPNSFIVRTVRVSDNAEKDTNRNRRSNSSPAYYQQW